jgi:phosphoribosyl 1,2-cyclic phosphodiesterase
MRFASIGSGSQGNGTVVEAAGSALLIDCGFGIERTLSGLAGLGLVPADLAGVLVTHEHADHAQGVAAFARSHGLTVLATAGTLRAMRVRGCRTQVISSHRDFELGAFSVRPVVVPHDAREPVQYVLAHAGRRLGVLTDAGHVTPHMLAAYGRCQSLLLECNHDPALLWQGRYPPALKRRVAGPHGHLNNGQAAGMLARLKHDGLERVVLAHLSEQNNTPGHARAAAGQALAGSTVALAVATQHEGFGWSEV